MTIELSHSKMLYSMFNKITVNINSVCAITRKHFLLDPKGTKRI